MSTFYTQLFVLGLFFISCEAFLDKFCNVFTHRTKWARGQWEKKENGNVICEGTFQSRKLKEVRKKAGLIGAGLAGTAAGAAALAAAGPAAIGLAAAVSGTSTVSALSGFFGTKPDLTTYQFKKGTFENKERILVTVEINGDIQYGYLTDIIIERTDGARAAEYTDKRYQAIFKMKSLTGNGRLCDRIVYYMNKEQQNKEESDFPKMLKKLHAEIRGTVKGHVCYTVKSDLESTFPTIQYNGAAEAPDFDDLTAAVAGKKMRKSVQLQRIADMEEQHSLKLTDLEAEFCDLEYNFDLKLKGVKETRIIEERKYKLKLKDLKKQKDSEIKRLKTETLRLQQRLTMQARHYKELKKLRKENKNLKQRLE